MTFGGDETSRMIYHADQKQPVLAMELVNLIINDKKNRFRITLFL